MYELFLFILINKGISSRAYNGGVRGKGGKSIVKNIHNVFRMIYILCTYNIIIILLYVILLVHCKKKIVMLSVLKFIPDRRSSNKAWEDLYN